MTTTLMVAGLILLLLHGFAVSAYVTYYRFPSTSPYKTTGTIFLLGILYSLVVMLVTAVTIFIHP